MELLEWEQNAELYLKKLNLLLTYQNGIMMVRQLIKLLLKVQKLFWNQLSISLIHLEEETTSWFSVKHIHGLMELLKNLLHQIPILENTQKKFLMLNLMSNHGSVLSKNISFFSNKTVSKQDHTDGQVQVFQETKVLIIVQ